MLQILKSLTVNQEEPLVAETAEVHDAQLSLVARFHEIDINEKQGS